MYLILALNTQNCFGFWGSAPHPPGGASGTPRTLSREGLLPFGTRNLTYSHVLRGTPASRSQFFPPCSPYSIPGSAPRTLRLWIFLYTLSPHNLCLWALCYLNPESCFQLIKTSLIYYFVDLIAKKYEINISKN